MFHVEAGYRGKPGSVAFDLVVRDVYSLIRNAILKTAQVCNYIFLCYQSWIKEILMGGRGKNGQGEM